MVAIDLGSNTLRAVRLACESGRFVGDFEKIVRTADGLQKSGRISQEAIERIVAAIAEMREVLRIDEEETIVACTTEAMRRASNGEAAIEEIFRRSGIRFRVISGEQEALLTLKAVRYRLQRSGLPDRSLIMVDIGGASTEIVYRTPAATKLRSFPVGIVTMAQRYGSLEAIASALPSQLQEARSFVTSLYAEEGRVESFVATAGTPTTVAAMKHGLTYESYDPRKINGTVLEKEELRRYLALLLKMSKVERERTVGVGREDLIAAGILIFEALFEIVEHERCVVIDDGLREGIALACCESPECRDAGRVGKINILGE